MIEGDTREGDKMNDFYRRQQSLKHILCNVSLFFLVFILETTIFTSNFRCSESDLQSFYFYGNRVTVVNSESNWSWEKMPPMKTFSFEKQEKCACNVPETFIMFHIHFEYGAMLHLIGLPISCNLCFLSYTIYLNTREFYFCYHR